MNISWPCLALLLLSSSTKTQELFETPSSNFVLRDPVIFTGIYLPELLDDLSYDPDLRLQIGTAGLRHLNDRTRHPIKLETNENSRRTLQYIVIQEARHSGMDPGYLLRLAARESGLNPLAHSPTSTATGLYQFTENTWLCGLKAFGAAFGLPQRGSLAKNNRGKCSTGDLDDDAYLLGLRADPALSTRMAAAFSIHNYEALKTKLGRPPSATELYVLHFFGESMGLRFIIAKDSAPSAIASELAPSAAMANRSLFYSKRSEAMPVSDVYRGLALR